MCLTPVPLAHRICVPSDMLLLQTRHLDGNFDFIEMNSGVATDIFSPDMFFLTHIAILWIVIMVTESTWILFV